MWQRLCVKGRWCLCGKERRCTVGYVAALRKCNEEGAGWVCVDDCRLPVAGVHNVDVFSAAGDKEVLLLHVPCGNLIERGGERERERSSPANKVSVCARV